MTPLVALVACGAAYSLTMLVVADKITARPREWVLTRLSGHGYDVRILGLDPATQDPDPGAVLGYRCACDTVTVSIEALLDHIHDARDQVRRKIPQTKTALLLYLMSCPWCAGVWVSFPVAWSAWCFGDRSWWFVPALALTARAVAGTWASFARP